MFRAVNRKCVFIRPWTVGGRRPRKVLSLEGQVLSLEGPALITCRSIVRSQVTLALCAIKT